MADYAKEVLERDLVEKPGFERLLGSRGIANDTTVILYGDRNRRLVDRVGQPRRRADRKGLMPLGYEISR